MKRSFCAVAIAAAAVGGGIALATPASADPVCGNAIVMGNGGGRCDSAPNPDGSFTQCDTVYVLGFGGTNCYTVYPPAEPS
jgi:hypothetical protein